MVSIFLKKGIASTGFWTTKLISPVPFPHPIGNERSHTWLFANASWLLCISLLTLIQIAPSSSIYNMLCTKFVVTACCL